MEPNNCQPIAIVGISCKFTKIADTNEFWKVLNEGKIVTSYVPKDRWDMDNYYDPSRDTPNKSHQRAGGFLENIHHFNPHFFNISPNEAYEMSPSQKLALIEAWKLIESSSIPFSKFPNSKTGVYMGNIWDDYAHFRKLQNSEVNNFTGIGQAISVIANRISYFFGLTGPSFMIDTGCSSSLIAIMQCVEALQYGKIDMGITGGISHHLDPDQYVYLSKFGGLSSNEKCCPFDEKGDGFIRSEGCGLLLLKRLEDAERDGDKIFALIRGGAVNNNGFNVNMPATSVKGQMELLDLAYKNAGINPADVHYIEAHGTGTMLGDPIEAESVGRFFSEKIGPDKKIIMGSGKPNVGHTEGAAGVTGLIKIVLSMNNHMIPKTLNFNNPNPKIKFDEWKLKIPVENQPWPVTNNETYKAGVSGYGWGGSNAHIVLEQYKPIKQPISDIDFNQLHYAIPVSAKSDSELKNYANVIADHIEHIEKDKKTSLALFCSDFSLRKPNLNYRKVIYAENSEHLIRNLRDFAKSEIPYDPIEAKVPGKKVFMFPGQGSQFNGMGKQLYESQPVFKKSIDECEKAFNKYVDWSLIDVINSSDDKNNLDKINVIQPYIFAIQISLAKLWISIGVIPDAIIGHSMGEVAAAHIAGILNINDAAKIICTRSRLMSTLKSNGGAMAATGLSAETASEVIKPYNGRVTIAVINSPNSTVLAGNDKDITALIHQLEENGIFVKQVNVDVAAHSPQMDPIKGNLYNELKNISPQKSKYDFYSTVREKIMDGVDLNATYWADNLRNTVQFESGLEYFLNNNYQLFMEVSPHPVLKTAVNECADNYDAVNIEVLGSMHRDFPENDEFMKNFSLLVQNGFSVNWNIYYNTDETSHIELPSYPMELQDYLVKNLSSLNNKTNGSSNLHPLLNEKIEIAGTDDIYYQSKISINNLSYLSQHKENKVVVFPNSFYLEMVLFVLKQEFPEWKYSLRNVKFFEPITLVEDTAVQMQLKIKVKDNVPESFELHSQLPEAGNWLASCSGIIFGKPNISVKERPETDNSVIVEKADIYQSFRNIGFEFGPVFQNITSIEGDLFNSITKIQIKDNIIPDSKKFVVNPIALDNIFQPSIIASVFGMFNDDNIISTLITEVEEIVFTNSNIGNELIVKTILEKPIFNNDKTSCTVRGDICVRDKNCEIVAIYKGINIRVSDTGVEKPVIEVHDDGEYLLNHIKKLEDIDEKIDVIQSHIVSVVAKLTKAHAEKINPVTTFKNLGIDSLATVQLQKRFENDFGISLSIKDFAKYLSPKQFSLYIFDLIKLNGSRITGKNKDPWFVKTERSENITHQIILFHDAGGSTRLFNNWDEFLPESTEIIAVELPGHGSRINEAPINDFEQLMAILIPKINSVINKPFSLYGHSMGGVIAYETACTLQKNYKKTAENIIVSGTPYLYNYENVFINTIMNNRLSDDNFRLLIQGITANTEKDFEAKTIKAFRADFELLYSYPYNNSMVLNSNIIALHAMDDDRIKAEDVKKWMNATDKKFIYEELKGAHNFVYNSGKIVSEIIKRFIRKTEDVVQVLS